MKIFASALATCCAFAGGAAATAGTLFVTNNGLDSNLCDAANPCRSISHAIDIAESGSVILVGPGRYGELDQSGALGGFGEESGANGVGITVNKTVSILSTTGADSTLIDFAGTVDFGVVISANGVKFGDRNTGFTIRGARSFGLDAESVTGVTVSGNTAFGGSFAAIFLRSTGNIEARGNTATNNQGTAIWAAPGGAGETGSVLLSGNTARDSLVGIAVGSGEQRIIGNRVIGNQQGIQLTYGPSRIAQNYVAGNRWGLQVNGFSDTPLAHGPQITRNDFVGNLANGVDVFPGPPGIIVALRENNFFGNGNCGVTNQTSIGGSTPVPVDARRNFWGAATGPSFSDPADPACQGVQPVLFAPFSTTEFDVR